MVEVPSLERVVSIVVCDAVYQDSSSGGGSAKRKTVIGQTRGADREGGRLLRTLR